LICNECGRVIEFFEPAIENLQDQVCEKYGFLAISHSHQLRGICRQCRPRVTSREATAARSAEPGRLRILPTA
ncbi:MAG: transcriptional repressor, partial [Acidobacteriota bacterium]